MSFIVGTRGSALALWQTRKVIELLAPRGTVTERIISTKGDRSQADKLVGQLEKGFFTQELEAALDDRSIQLAVHSLKDLPTRIPSGLCVGAVLERAAPYDLLLMREDKLGAGRLPIAAGARIGSSSVRRAALLGRYAPTAVAVPLRGNVPTRLEKLRAGQYDGILLAAAGVLRLELPLDGLAVFKLDPRTWTPAPGQGAIAVECRADDTATRELLASIHHPPTERAVGIERDLLRVFEGGCTTPFGCHVDGDQVWVGLLAHQTWRWAKWSATNPSWEQQLAALAAPDFVETPHDDQQICSRL